MLRCRSTPAGEFCDRADHELKLAWPSAIRPIGLRDESIEFEIGNALTAMMKKSSLKKEDVISAWEVVQQIPVDLRHTDIKSALRIAIKFNIYAYDAYFLECAENLRSPLLTLDIGLKRVARELGITILE